jgi:hypothetical protein
VNSLAVTGFPSVITAGTGGSFRVTALNSNGSTDTSYTGTVHFTSSDPQAVLPANYTFTATLKTAGTQSITATDTANGSIVGSAGSPGPYESLPYKAVAICPYGKSSVGIRGISPRKGLFLVSLLPQCVTEKTDTA